MFIQKIQNITVDLDQVKQDLSEILKSTQWFPENQIGLTYRVGATDPWKDSAGSLYDRANLVKLDNENAFTEFNQTVPIYTTAVLDQLAKQENFKLGRVRYMQLESKKGLTVHKDTSIRYHLVIETNPCSYIAHTVKTNSVKAMCYHLPADGHFYQVDTTQAHFVYNGGTDSRTHLVICPV